MKDGIDFQHFIDAPNFEMATSYPAAMVLIEEMVKLFTFRRDYLIRKKKINWTELSIKELARDKAFEDLPIGPVLIVVDELAELSKKASDAETSADLKKSISTLAMLSRVTGIHLYAYQLALNTGLRAGEIWGLQAGDLEEGGEVIFVRRQFNLASHEYGPPKGRKTRRVPCNEALRRELLGYNKFGKSKY